MGRRLMDTSYTTTSPEVIGKDLKSSKRIKGGVNTSRKGTTLIDSEDGFNQGRGYGFRRIEEDDGGGGEADTWSIQRGPPSSVPSAKCISEFGKNFTSSPREGGGGGEGRGRVGEMGKGERGDFEILNRSRERDRGGGGENFGGETTDDEFGMKCISNMSSASSSISWAEDAVEAELTRKMFSFWEDVQRVCTGEVCERPADMSSQIFEECLKWKRAFPIQDLARFTKLSDSDSGFTPTPTGLEAIQLSSRSSPAYKSSSPESPNSICITPNPERSPSYVSMWLSDCKIQGPLTHNSAMEQTNNGYKVEERNASQLLEDVESLSLSLSEGEAKESSASTTLYSNSNRHPGYRPRSNNPVIRESQSESFDTTTQSLEASLNDTDQELDLEASQLHISRSSADNHLRVQRPISSSVKGHMLTPLPNHSAQHQGRGHYGRSCVPAGNPSRESGRQHVNPSVSVHYRGKERGETDFQSYFSNSQYSNFHSERRAARGGKSATASSVQRRNFETYANGETPPNRFTPRPSATYPKDGKKSGLLNRRQGMEAGKSNPMVNNGGGFPGNVLPGKGPLDFEFGKRSNNSNVHGAKPCPSTSSTVNTSSSSSSGCSNSRIVENSFVPHNMGYQSVITQNRHWSRHSSICTANPLMMDRVHQQGVGIPPISARHKPIHDPNNYFLENHLPLNPSYGNPLAYTPQHHPPLLPPIPNNQFKKRPDNLPVPVSRINADQIKRKPARPFLYWLLDKVSPS